MSGRPPSSGLAYLHHLPTLAQVETPHAPAKASQKLREDLTVLQEKVAAANGEADALESSLGALQAACIALCKGHGILLPPRSPARQGGTSGEAIRQLLSAIEDALRRARDAKA